MPRKTVVYWIKEASYDKFETLHLLYVQLSTWRETKLSIYREHRAPFKQQIQKLMGTEVSSVDDLVDKVITAYPDSPMPEAYIGDMRKDIIPDRHEPDKIAKHFVTPVPLYAGDYLWKTKKGDIVVVERKVFENGELIDCLFKPRGTGKGSLETALTAQASKMQTVGSIRILLIELGIYSIDFKTGRVILPKSHRLNRQQERDPIWPYKWSTIQNRLFSLCDKWNILPWFSYNHDTVPYDLIDIRAYLDKSEHLSNRIVRTPMIIHNTKDYPASVQSLCFVAGVGPKLMQGALKHFGNLKNAINASEEEWNAVSGIGKVKAEAIFKAINEEGS